MVSRDSSECHVRGRGRARRALRAEVRSSLATGTHASAIHRGSGACSEHSRQLDRRRHGGYLAAQGTGGSGSKAALVFGLVYLTIVTALVVFGHRDSEWWWYIAPLAIIVPAAFLGGRLAMRAGVTSAST